jgi:hypothetical protein
MSIIKELVPLIPNSVCGFGLLSSSRFRGTLDGIFRSGVYIFYIMGEK